MPGLPLPTFNLRAVPGMACIEKEMWYMLRFIWEHLAVVGFVSLAVLFVVSFFFRTAWGHWHKGRGRLYEGLTKEEREDLHRLHRD